MTGDSRKGASNTRGKSDAKDKKAARDNKSGSKTPSKEVLVSMHQYIYWI